MARRTSFHARLARMWGIMSCVGCNNELSGDAEIYTSEDILERKTGRVHTTVPPNKKAAYTHVAQMIMLIFYVVTISAKCLRPVIKTASATARWSDEFSPINRRSLRSHMPRNICVSRENWTSCQDFKALLAAQSIHLGNSRLPSQIYWMEGGGFGFFSGSAPRSLPRVNDFVPTKWALADG